MNYSDYPENWEEIRAEVLERARNADGISQCECIGECGRDHKGTRCPHLQYGLLTTKSRYKVILTTAHLCHTPKCDRRDHLKSMCQPCHQVFDLRERQKRGETRVRKSRATEADKSAKREVRPLAKRQLRAESAGSLRRIPSGESLLLPVLRLLGDGLNQSSDEVQQRLRIQFEIDPDELVQKLRNGKCEFHSNIDLALAYLQGAPHGGAKAISRVDKKLYKITELGKAILKGSRTDLTIKDLRSWASRYTIYP